ncbi:hypothetical protein VE03_07906 [Pseudogymnoascus sp. 23342-1-I1]|nr:hypothetical protein VE03_07906 [Pseudogymnoascus sp. 23342-1-I1]
MTLDMDDSSFITLSLSEYAFDGELTPSSTTFNQDSNLLDQWEKALEECKSILDPAAYKQVLEFGSPEKLVEDLRIKEQAAGSSWPSSLISEVTPTLEVLKIASNFFMSCMQPKNVTTSVIWGFLHLALVMSTQNKGRWQQMSHILQRIRELLQRLQVSADKWGNDSNEQLKQAILDVFKALIFFWAGASRYMREHKPGSKLSVGSVTNFLDQSFEETFKRMDSAVRNLYELAAIKAIGLGERRSNYQDEIMASAFSTRHTLFQESPYLEAQLRQLPYDNTDSFFGRNDVLDKISLALDPSARNKQQYFTLSGLGGVGKSSVALAYANRSVCKYDAIFWVRAETEASLFQSFADIALNLDIPDASRTAAPSENRDLLISWFIKCNMTWLLVLDNVEDLKLVNAFIPSFGGSILITTRRSQVARLAPGDPSTKLCLQPFTDKEDWGFLEGQMKEFPDSEWQDADCVSKEEKAAAKKLLEFLGGLPLGIKQVTALINVNYLSVSDFLALYTQELGDLRKIYGDEDEEMRPDYRYQYGLSTVWKISFDSLKSKKDHNAYYYLGMMSLMSPDLIPWSLFEAPVAKMINFKADLKTFVGARSELAKAAIVDINVKDKTISIHRLVQTSFLHYLEPSTLQVVFDMITTLLNARFPKQVKGRPLLLFWSECEKYYLHVIKVASWYSSLRDSRQIVANLDFVELMSNCSWYLHESGKSDDCLNLVEAGKEACTDKDSLLYSHLLNTAGAQLLEQNKLILMRQNLERSLEIREKFLAEDDEDLLCTLNNFANLKVAEGRYFEAILLDNRVVAAKESMGQGSGPLVAMCSNALARAHMGNGDFIEAKANLDISYAIMEAEAPHYIPG